MRSKLGQFDVVPAGNNRQRVLHNLPIAAPIGYLERMPGVSLEIIPCPPQRIAEALALVLSDVAPGQRREIAGRLLDVDDPTELSGEPLYVALRKDRLCGAAWGQRQPGDIAVYWPPQLAPGESDETAILLTQAVVGALDNTTIELTQTLLPSRGAPTARVLKATGFSHLADLLYMYCEAERFPTETPDFPELQFVRYNASRRSRLMKIIARSYEQTLDCVPLNGIRTVDNVITGYQNTGVFRPENWLLVRGRNRDAGVLLLAAHPKAGHWELVYMGLAPEARGRGWGRQITRYAQWLARQAGVARIVVAVDSANAPALKMYRTAGFEVWDRRTVYVRFPAT
jgi:ribosomal protein S18 acetylase RimI-like enzyme